MTDNIVRLLQLTPDQRAEKLAAMRRDIGSCAIAVVPTQAPLRPVPRAPAMPASHLQEQMLFLHLLRPRSAAYHIPFAFDLDGHLDALALQRTWSRLMARHEILRTAIVMRAGEIVQQIAPAGPVEIEHVDLTGAAGPATVGEWIHELVHRPFELARPPLIRVGLVRTGATHHIMVGVAHHAILDGLSLNAMTVELVDTYRDVLASEPELAPPRVQYADFAHHQRTTLSPERIAELALQVRPQLVDAPTLDPPTDHPRPPVADFAGDMLLFELPALLDDAVHQSCRDLGATPFMLLMVAYLVTVAGWTQDHDITVGTSVSGRETSEMRAMLGPLLNVVPLRVGDIRGRTLGRLVLDVRELTAAAISGTTLPIGRLVSLLAPPRDPSRNPVYQTMFDLNECRPGQTKVTPSLSMTFRPVDLKVSQMDLAVVMDREGGRLRGRIEYRTNLFEPDTIARLCREFIEVISAMTGDLGQDAEALAVCSRARAGWGA